MLGLHRQHDGTWRIRNNLEINVLVLISNANIVRFKKSQRIRWLGLVRRMELNTRTKEITEWTLLRLEIEEGQEMIWFRICKAWA